MRGRYPKLTALPVINPALPLDKNKVGSSVRLICSFEVEETAEFEVQFIVTWFKVVRFMAGTSGRLVLFRQRTNLKKAILDYDTVDLSLGDTVRHVIIFDDFYSHVIHNIYMRNRNTKGLLRVKPPLMRCRSEARALCAVYKLPLCKVRDPPVHANI